MKIETNADLARQNHGEIVSGTKKKYISQISLDFFVSNLYIRNLYNNYDHFLEYNYSAGQYL